jgi:hypothetical protein
MIIRPTGAQQFAGPTQRPFHQLLVRMEDLQTRTAPNVEVYLMVKKSTITGFSHPRCYANGDADCSQTISKEHFISEVLLRRIELDGLSKVAGLAWQSPQTFNKIATKGLASHILCDRHNSRLSNLDAKIGMLVDDIQSIDRGRLKTGQSVRTDGPNIERWMLKCLVGLSVSGNIKNQVKPECVDLLFERLAWPGAWGLYFDTNNTTIYHTDAIRIETMADGNGLVLATKFFLQGLPFILLLGRPDEPSAFGIWRPARILFQLPSTQAKLIIRWKGPASGKTVQLTRSGAYDGDPPDWKDFDYKE